MNSRPARVVLISGPPCSGKTTAAQRWSSPGDLLLDFDEFARGLGSPAKWLHSEPWRSQADAIMRDAIASLPGEGSGTAYVIRSAAALKHRKALARSLSVEACVVLNPGIDECLARAKHDGRPNGTADQIRNWYRIYTPWSQDLTTWGSPVSVAATQRASRFAPSREW